MVAKAIRHPLWALAAIAFASVAVSNAVAGEIMDKMMRVQHTHDQLVSGTKGGTTNKRKTPKGFAAKKSTARGHGLGLDHTLTNKDNKVGGVDTRQIMRQTQHDPVQAKPKISKGVTTKNTGSKSRHLDTERKNLSTEAR